MNFFRTKLKGLTAVFALVAAASLAGCGDDEQTQNGAIGAPGTAINGVVPGVSNCTTQFGQPGVLVNGVCMPNNQNMFPQQTFCSNYIMNNGAYMCPCSGITGNTSGVIVTGPGWTGGTSCGGYQPVWIASYNQYYYYISLNYLYPSYYNSTYQNYLWNGSTWIYFRF